MPPVTQNGLVTDDSLYDTNLLKRIDITKSRTKFDPPISVTQPGDSLLFRPLELGDYDRGFIQLLGQLTEIGEISREQFQKRFELMKSCPDTYYVTVIEDTNTNQVVGCATLVVEQKFIHGCAVHIEEPMYDPELLSDFEFDKDGPFLVRPLQPSDYNTGFLQLLELIKPLEGVTKELYLKRFAEMKGCPNTYYVTVIEDRRSHEIIATATLLKEQKYFYKCAERGRLQDVAVSEKYQGQKLGAMIVNVITHLAKKLDCYKVSLDCNDRVVSFYEKLGYEKELNYCNFLQNFLSQ